MTTEHIQRRIEMIRGLGHDFESQHDEEDLLMRDVLRAIATNDIGSTADDAQHLAEAALECCKLQFTRVFA